MSVERVLVISTAHLESNIAKSMELGIKFGIDDVYKRPEGFVLFPYSIQVAIDNGILIPKCISDIANLAILEECTMILIDRDGELDNRIPSYNW